MAAKVAAGAGPFTAHSADRFVCLCLLLHFQPNENQIITMKKLFASVAVLSLSIVAVQAQSTDTERQNTRNGAEIQRTDGTRQAVRLEDGKSLREVSPQVRDQSQRSVSQEQIDRAIADIEQKMKEGEGQADFPREAYEKRLEHLLKLKEQD